jgi:uncharacterized protein involved in outer membrane biogenesis
MRRPFKYLVYITASVFILAVFFAFGLPAILRAVLASQLAKNLHRPASVESVSFNPFKLCLTVQKLAVREPDNATVFVSFDLLRVNAEIASVFEGGIDLSEVSLVNPHARIVRTEANTYNFSDLLTGEGKKPEEQPSKPLLFSVANIQIAGGSVEFDDRPKKASHRITALELGLPLLSNFKQNVDIFEQPSFSATINGKPFKLTGQTKPFADSLETSAEINITDLSLAQYMPYVPATLNFKMPSGRLSTRLVINYIQSAKKTAEVKVQGKLGLAELEIISLDSKPILKLPSLSVSGIDCKISSREAGIDEISVDGLSVALAREKDGSISLQKLVGPDNQTGGKSAAPAQQEPPSGPAWTVQVKKFKFARGAVSFDDLLPARSAQFRIDPIDFTLSNISTAPNASAEIDFGCRINKESTLSLQGSFTIAPPGANLKIDLAGLDIRFAQSYMPDTLLLDLTSGTLGLKGSVDVKQGKEGKDAAPAILWQGDIRLANFASVRRGDKEDLLKCSSLDLQSMRAGMSPLSLDIKTVTLAGLFMRPVVEADGTVNVTSLSAAPSAPAPKPAAASSPKEPLPNVNIGSLVLEKGRMQFTDKSIKPRYSADLADIQGRITGISTKPDSQADIRLTAKLNRYAPFKITGIMKPLQEKLDADIKVLFNNIDLSPFSPYSGKFVGRVIEKGRLSLELTYTIKDNKLTSQNKVFLDQFTLGKSVDSKDATSLPVGLAISLLKDRKGEIHLDLPVSGSLDDPSFKVGAVVLQMLVNLLEKAATSPFALVGALIPGGADISNIPFTCGTAELNDNATKKLDALAGLLTEKTDLSLEIQAAADAEADREGLRHEMVMRRMRALKFNDLSKKEKEGLTPEKVVITSGEYEDYLWQAYKAEKIPKQTVLGMTKKLPAEEMKKLMAEHMQVDDEDMKDLLQQRGLAVKQYLTETAKVPAERLFIIDSRIDSGKGPSGCCVEFKLK